MKSILLLLFACTSALFVSAKVDFIRVMFNTNGDNSATIGWNQVSGDSAIIFWGTKDIQATNYLDYSNIAHVSAQNEYKGMRNNFVRLQGLRANTAYYFTIKDSDGISERFWFKTTPNDANAKLSLVAGGDSRTNRKVRQNAFRMVGKLVPHAILFDGDYTELDTEDNWRKWFQDYKLTYSAFDNRVIPIITTRGNHERNKLCLPKFFDCPAENSVYNVTLGGELVNVLCLNTEIAFGGKQKKFLDKTLLSHSSFSWQIPMYHRACRPHINWKMKLRQVNAIYRKWIHLFEKHGVRLAIECDSHITKSTWPIVKQKGKLGDDGFKRDDKNGIVYAGEGCWGAPLRVPDRIRVWTRDVGKLNSFKWLFVTKSEIEMRTVAYMNVSEVENLTEETRFGLPKNIDIWSPENGAVVTINK
jgi:Purple acid Phosphatase, N-terminal domain/Calcineurin-like phosphoesterase